MESTSSKITAGELVLVCSRYDLGEIHSLRRFKGGSRTSPKVIVESDRGTFLLKRRAPGTGEPARVALSHQVQLHLLKHGFPVAPLMGTRKDNNSLLELNGAIYEVFRFLPGDRYPRSQAAAFNSGRSLAGAHALLTDLVPDWKPPAGNYHAHPAVASHLAELPGTCSEPRLRPLCESLISIYRRAGEEAERLGLGTEPSQLIHGDWHPGNLLFGAAPDHPVLAVLDFDAVRSGPRVLDLANGALQFSVARRLQATESERPRITLSAPLFSAFTQGYRTTAAPPRTWSALPWLMIQALVVETVAPIAATGHFGRIGAFSALQMAIETAQWIARDAATLVSLGQGS